MKYGRILAAAVAAAALFAASQARADGDAAAGEKVFKAHLCFACHRFEAGKNGAGPSLHGVFGRKAGSLASFVRYSPALKRSGITWDERTLDAWIRDPQALVPGNYMSFRGLPDSKSRAELIAYLETASQGAGAAELTSVRELPDSWSVSWFERPGCAVLPARDPGALVV